MSFVDGFYSFFVELSDTQREFYESVKCKAVKHPDEPLSYLVGRVIALLHSYQEGIEFTQGLFEPKDPTFICKDVTGRVLLWGDVGVPPKKKLMHALKQLEGAIFRVYFQNKDEVLEFCHHMRGAKSNWVEAAEFYLLEPEFIENLVEHLELRSYWDLTFCDNSLYLSMGELDFQSEILPLNIWEWYQESLESTSHQ